MKQRILTYFLLQFVLTACVSWSIGDKENQPAPLPKIEQSQQQQKINTIWKHSIGKPISKEAGQSMLALVGTDIIAITNNSQLYRINTQTGQIVWQIKASKVKVGIAANDKYIALVDQKNQLIILSALDGKQIWSTQLDTQIQSAPNITDNHVILRNISNKLIAFNLDTQKLVWQHERIAQNILLHGSRNAIISPKKGWLISGFHGAKLVMLNSINGSAKWEQTLSYSKGFTDAERINDIVGTPSVYADTVCAVSYQGNIACFDVNTGSLNWDAPFSSVYNLVTDQRGVYAINMKGLIYAFDYSGKIVWQQNALRNRAVNQGVLLDNTLIYNDYKGFLHLLDKQNGSVVGQFKLDTITTPMLKMGSNIIAYTDDGNIYGLTLTKTQ
jgi:outer membrane protein assembly factor BamB